MIAPSLNAVVEVRPALFILILYLPMFKEWLGSNKMR